MAPFSLSDREPLVNPRPHRVGQSALEERVDLRHVTTGNQLAFELAQAADQILPQIPKGLQVVGKSDALRQAL